MADKGFIDSTFEGGALKTAEIDAGGAVMETDFDANTILAATTDDTPVAIVVAEQTLVGRITSGNIVALTVAQCKTLLDIAASVAPEKQTCWHDESVVTVGNAITSQVNAANKYNFQGNQGTAADADSFEQQIFLAAGTYTVYFLGVTDSNRGLIDWFLDATEIITAQDWYSAATTYNVVKSQASVNVPTSKVYTIKGTVDGKNGSSSDYFIVLIKYWFEKTA